MRYFGKIPLKLDLPGAIPSGASCFKAQAGAMPDLGVMQLQVTGRLSPQPRPGTLNTLCDPLMPEALLL